MMTKTRFQSSAPGNDGADHRISAKGLQKVSGSCKALGFTLLTSGIMIYIMGVYNVALHSGGLKYATFALAAKNFLLEWAIGFLLAFFVAGKLAPRLAFRVARPEDRPIFKILCIQTFTVCIMVPLMSLVGVLESSGLHGDLPVLWLNTLVLNFVMAYPLQIFVVGPLCRLVFRAAFGWQPGGR